MGRLHAQQRGANFLENHNGKNEWSHHCGHQLEGALGDLLGYFTDSLVVAVSAEEVFGVVGLEGGVLGGEVAAAHRADEAGRVEDDPQRPQDLARAQRLLPALEAARVATLLLLKGRILFK